MTTVQETIERIKARHDPEADMIPNGPRVTWAEAQLADALAALLARVEALEREAAEATEWARRQGWEAGE